MDQAGHRHAEGAADRSALPGTYRVADGAAFPFAEALPLWCDASLPVLTDTARVYNAVITYTELAEHVQDRVGVRTKMLLPNWIGQVLEHVAAKCHRDGELQLTALCVHQDGTVGAGYAGAVGRYGGGLPADPELHAAAVRLECYRKYAPDVPLDGGVPRLTPQEQARRKAAALPPQDRFCPVHRTALPRSGQCDDCD